MLRHRSSSRFLSFVFLFIILGTCVIAGKAQECIIGSASHHTIILEWNQTTHPAGAYPYVGLDINSPANCVITATSDQPWIQFSGPVSGAVVLNLSFNESPNGRGGTITFRTGNSTRAVAIGQFARPQNQIAIYGKITNGTTPLSGIPVVLGGSSSANRTTDVNGAYSFITLTSGGNYTVTPSPPAGINFNPPSYSFSNLTSYQVANFTAGQPPPTPQIQITLEGHPANEPYVITAEPRMPPIQTRATVTNDPNPNGRTLIWEVLGFIPSGPNGLTFASFYEDIVQNEEIPVAGVYTLRFNNASYIRGGLIEIRAKALVNNQEYVGTTGLIDIHGTNPSRAAIQAEIDRVVDQNASAITGHGLTTIEVKDALKRIGCQESVQKQFRADTGGTGNSVGPALISFDNGAGIFQITNTPHCPSIFASPECRNTIFDWKANVAEGVYTLVHAKIPKAKNYPTDLRARSPKYRFVINKPINTIRRYQELPLISAPPAPEFTHTGLIGDSCPNGIACNQLLETAVREFNGNGNTVLKFNQHTILGALREFRPDFSFLGLVPDLENPQIAANSLVWKRVTGLERIMNVGGGVYKGEPYYFDRVKAQNPETCVSSFTRPVIGPQQGLELLSLMINTMRMEIKTLPDSKFANQPLDSRRELLALIDLIERDVNDGNNQAALQTLTQRLKPRAEVAIKKPIMTPQKENATEFWDMINTAEIVLQDLIQQPSVSK